MFLDPLSGKIIFTPEQLKNFDPLLVQFYYHPETLTPEQSREAHLRALSAFCDLLPLDELKKIEKAAIKTVQQPKPKESLLPFDPAIAEMVSGKISLREMGLAQQRNPNLYAMADLLDRERKRAAAKKRKRQQARPKADGKKSAATKTNAAKRKSATRRPRKTRKRRA